MTTKRPIGWRAPLAVLLLAGTVTPAAAQVTMYLQDPENTDCRNTIGFCTPLEAFITIDTTGRKPASCYYFSFGVSTASGSTTITANSSTGAYVDLIAAPAPTASCSEAPCSGATASSDVLTGNLAIGHYLLIVNLHGMDHAHVTFSIDKGTLTPCDSIPCPTCLPSFAPDPGKRYVLSAWSMVENAPAGTASYSSPKITVSCTGCSAIPDMHPTGPIIDGWQRVEEEFDFPATATDIKIELGSASGNVFFDDVRVFPADGTMKCFVYDPARMRLVAELDERHFATRYEYDPEGHLIRVKKETERGVMTIQESRSNPSKRSGQ